MMVRSAKEQQNKPPDKPLKDMTPQELQTQQFSKYRAALLEPENKYLQDLLHRDKNYGLLVINAMLNADPKKPQWSAIAALNGVQSLEIENLLRKIALNDPDRTDRAFALRELGSYSDKESESTLVKGVFDDWPTIRLFCVELLAARGHHKVDPIALIPYRMGNAFTMYFSQCALLRLMPKLTPADIFQVNDKNAFGLSFVSAGTFLKLPIPEQIAQLKKVSPNAVDSYLEIALQNEHNAAVLESLFVLGSEQQANEAIKGLEKVLADQGKLKDYDAFVARSSIIEAFQSSDASKRAILEREFVRVIDSYSEEDALLLTTLCYGLKGTSNQEVLKRLSEVKALKSKHFDLYVAAASTLADAHSKLAFPSLIQILTLKAEPFCTVAARRLHDLTGISGPGDAPNYGMLHNVGIPEFHGDDDKNYRFWSEWYADKEKHLKFEDKRGRFVVEGE
jgi:hypothetical protein